MRTMDDTGVRLQKILSGAGVASRRAAERLIVEGRVSINGQSVTALGTRADPFRDEIRVDGRRIQPAARKIYLLLNKPRGCVATRSDPEGRPTVLDLLPGVREYVYPVGRLDYDSEGLLLLTNDGELAAHLMHPRHEVSRVYEVRVRGLPDQAALARLARGVVLDGRRTSPAGVRLLAAAPGSSTDRVDAARGAFAAGPPDVRGHRTPGDAAASRADRPAGGRPPQGGDVPPAHAARAGGAQEGGRGSVSGAGSTRPDPPV